MKRLIAVLVFVYAATAQATDPRVEPQWNTNMLGCEEWETPDHHPCAEPDHCIVHTFDKYYGTHDQALEAVRLLHVAYPGCTVTIMHITHRGTQDGFGWEWDVWEYYAVRDRICRRIDYRTGHRYYRSWEPACYEEFR